MLLLLVASLKKAVKKTERWCPDPMPSTIALWVNLVGVDCS
jgi:hypothetical protein